MIIQEEHKELTPYIETHPLALILRDNSFFSYILSFQFQFPQLSIEFFLLNLNNIANKLTYAWICIIHLEFISWFDVSSFSFLQICVSVVVVC